MNKRSASTILNGLTFGKVAVCIGIGLLVVLMLAAVYTDAPVELENARVYECDYKTLSLNTAVSTTIDGESITISGNIFKIVTDPLVMKNNSGKVLAEAGDTYGFISQDDHAIYVGGKFEVNMCGEFNVFGEKYSLKDENNNVVGTIKFNMFNSVGEITDVSGDVIATFYSPVGFNDYTVKIADNNICSDKAILMIMASYMSDYKYDNNTKSN